MNIGEAEKKTGISRKTIRFYEEQELLNPDRAENGYRVYGQKDIDALAEIKFMRSMSIPIDTIRKVRAGSISLADAVRIQMDAITKEQEDMEKVKELGKLIVENDLTLETVDMDGMEEKLREIGETRLSAMEEFNHKQLATSNIAGIIFILFFAVLGAVIIWAAAADMMPLWIAILCMAFIVWPIIGTMVAMVQRKKEIKRGEIYDAAKY